MFSSLKARYTAITILLLCALLIGGALAEEPVCTLTYDKDFYSTGETITAHYKIDFGGEFAALYVEWGILPDWESDEIQPTDSFQELTALEGDISFTPAHGEGVAPYFTLVESSGNPHSFWGSPAQITGESSSVPTCSIAFDKDSYLLGETVNVHYKIDFAGECSAIYAEWGIIADWETDDIRFGDSYHELTALEGDLSFTPSYGEGVILYFTLVEASGDSHSFRSESVKVTGSAASEPTCIVSYGKDSYTLGETISAHYKIDFDGEFSALYAEWGIITDWETNDIQFSDTYHELTALEGELSFAPTYGEGAVLYFTLVKKDNTSCSFWSDPVRVTGNTVSEPKCSVAFDKDSYTLGETINAHYRIDFDGEYASLYAEWGIVADWETNDIRFSDSYHELTALEGDLSFTPAYGEGAVLYFTLAEANGKWYSLSGDPVRIYSTGITYLPRELAIIEEEAFASAMFTRIVCPESLHSIESRAFSDCINLQSVTIPASVQYIADDAFDGCASLAVIITEEGSAAEEYARRHGYEIIYL